MSNDEPTKVYVAGPMTGYPDFNYPAFDAAERALLDHGYGVFNPTRAEEFNDTGKSQEWAWYMRHALRMVVSADALAILPGWEDSRGARLEVQVAQALGMPVRPIAEWLSL